MENLRRNIRVLAISQMVLGAGFIIYILFTYAY